MKNELTNVICRDCAIKSGWKPSKKAHACSMWEGECDACGEVKCVTSVRDYGYPEIYMGQFKEPEESRRIYKMWKQTGAGKDEQRRFNQESVWLLHGR